MTITVQKLSMSTSYQQRSIVALASVVITLAVIVGNLQLARGYDHASRVGTTTAQSAEPARG